VGSLTKDNRPEINLANGVNDVNFGGVFTDGIPIGNIGSRPIRVNGDGERLEMNRYAAGLGNLFNLGARHQS
jgi:hypothetical protein